MSENLWPNSRVIPRTGIMTIVPHARVARCFIILLNFMLAAAWRVLLTLTHEAAQAWGC